MAKKKPVYRMIEYFNHDSAACQEALMILRSVELTPEQIAKIREANKETSTSGKMQPSD